MPAAVGDAEPTGRSASSLAFCAGPHPRSRQDAAPTWFARVTRRNGKWSHRPRRIGLTRLAEPPSSQPRAGRRTDRSPAPDRCSRSSRGPSHRVDANHASASAKIRPPRPVTAVRVLLEVGHGRSRTASRSRFSGSRQRASASRKLGRENRPRRTCFLHC
jgi:hypothetical protein